jgi:hypothetical protein
MKSAPMKSTLGLLAHGLPEADAALVTAAAEDAPKRAAVKAHVLKLAGIRNLDPNNVGEWLALFLRFAPEILTFLKGK